MAVPVLNERGTAPSLEVTNLEVTYKGSVVGLRGVTVEVKPGSFTAVLGSNGAGKTTLVRAVTGLLFVHQAQIREGDIFIGGEHSNGWTSDQIVKAGVCQVPEGRMLFPTLSVEENLRVGASTRKDRAEINNDIERMWETFPQLYSRREEEAGWLSGGEQQMVAIGRALMARPRLLVCDELSLGLAPQITHTLFELIRSLNSDQGMGVLMIEQNARLALQYSDYGYILETGRVVLDGPSASLRENEDVQEFYLGGGADSDSYRDIKHYKKRKRWLA